MANTSVSSDSIRSVTSLNVREPWMIRFPWRVISQDV